MLPEWLKNLFGGGEQKEPTEGWAQKLFDSKDKKRQGFISPIGDPKPTLPAEGMAYGQMTKTPPLNYSSEENAFKPPVPQEQAPPQQQGAFQDENLLSEIRLIAEVADRIGVPAEYLVAQYFQESSFGRNPSINEENSASALGPMQITAPFTKQDPPAYPAYPELYIDPEQRRELEPSAEFAAKHFKRWREILGDDDAAINRYYGDDTYAPLIRGHLENPDIVGLLKQVGVRQ